MLSDSRNSIENVSLHVLQEQLHGSYHRAKYGEKVKVIGGCKPTLTFHVSCQRLGQLKLTISKRISGFKASAGSCHVGFDITGTLQNLNQ